MERNPYFFAVDQEGNQLPYIDKVTHRLYQASAPDVLTLRVTNGEIDMQYRLMSIANLPLYKAGEAKGDYKTVLGVTRQSRRHLTQPDDQEQAARRVLQPAQCAHCHVAGDQPRQHQPVGL